MTTPKAERPTRACPTCRGNRRVCSVTGVPTNKCPCERGRSNPCPTCQGTGRIQGDRDGN